VSKNFIVLEVSHGLVKLLKAIQRRIYLFECILACKIPAKYSMSVMYLAGVFLRKLKGSNLRKNWGILKTNWHKSGTIWFFGK
jgi:hypothetical protein